MSHTAVIAVLSIAVAGVAAQWLAWRFKLPAIVLLFAVGLLIGPGLQILHPSTDLPGTRPLIGLAVAIVLFEGGLALDFRELRAAGEGVLRLSILALPISFVLAAAAAYAVGRMGWRSSLLFGAITTVTGPTVVLPLLRHTRLERRTASFLKWEAIVNDPIGALLASIVLSLMLAGADRGAGAIALSLVLGILVATALGVGAAYLMRWLVLHDLTPENLKTPILLALAMAIYVVSNLVTNEAGLAAAVIFGMALANLHIPGIGEIHRFKASLAVLLVSALFIVLTANLDRSLFTQISWPIIGLTLVMMFVVRPAAIWLATAWSGGLWSGAPWSRGSWTPMTWQERTLVGWIAPRGIVAASVAGIAAQKLEGEGFPGSELVMPAVFALIAATMILHGFSLGPLARRLNLTLGDKPALAILGASRWSLGLAIALREAGTPVTLIDADSAALRRARVKRIAVVRADMLSEHGEDQIADRRIDYFLAATPNDIYNSLVCAKLAPEIGRNRVFQLAPLPDELENWKALNREWRGILVGEPPLDFETARKRYKEGWRFVLEAPVAEGEDADDADDDTGVEKSDAVAVLFLRRNGEVAFCNPEGNSPSGSPGDRRLVLVHPAKADVPVAREVAEVD